MNKSITFTIDAEPVPKGRPRYTKAGRPFTPAGTRRYEEMVQRLALRETGGTRILGRVRIRVEFHRGSHRRVDLDNLLKAVLDGMNGAVYEDDAQITEVVATKRLGAEEPRTVVTVEEIPN